MSDYIGNTALCLLLKKYKDEGYTTRNIMNRLNADNILNSSSRSWTVTNLNKFIERNYQKGLNELELIKKIGGKV